MSIEIVDTHCHLNHEQFDMDAAAAIARAAAAGVERMVVVGFDISSSEAAVRLAAEHDHVFAAVAIHPHDSRLYDAAAEERLRELARHPETVAVGEIGLDYHYRFSSTEAQRTAFTAQLALASDLGLPVIIHCREAYGDVLDVLDSRLDRRFGGVMHCWAGSVGEAGRALALGMYLGFAGVLTFKNGESVRESARLTPIDRMLVETDAPYLSPFPHRGKRNEPAYARIVAEKLAEIRGLSLGEIAASTTQNAARLFPKMTAKKDL